MGIQDILLNRRIRTQLILGFTLVILLTIVTIVIPVTIDTASEMETTALAELDTFGGAISTLVGDFIQEEYEITHVMAQSPAIRETATQASSEDPINLWNSYEGADWGDDSDSNTQPSKTEAPINTTNDFNPVITSFIVDVIVDLDFVEIFFTDARGYVISSNQNTGDFAQSDEGWYQEAVINGFGVSDFEFDESSESWSISFSYPIKSTNETITNGPLAGVMKATYSFVEIAKNIEESRDDGLSLSVMVDDIGNIVAHPKTELIGQNFDDLENTNPFSTLQDPSKVSILVEGVEYYVAVNDIELLDTWGLEWVIITLMDTSAITDQIQDSLLFTLLSSLLGLLIGIIVAIYLSSLLTKRIIQLDEITTEISKGNLSVELIEAKNNDEIGNLTRNMRKMVENLRELLLKTSENIQTLSQASETLTSASEETNASTEEVSSTSQSMSQAASQQAEMIAKSVEEITNIGDIVNDIIDQIQSNSDIISQIALQTNILALNAGIEASRAGDYGRGFAVVAENVRRLSEESKNAANEITEVASSIADTLSGSFEAIRVQIEEVAALSEETAASAEEVAAAAEEVTASMEEVSASSIDLFSLVRDSTDQISKFKF